MSSHRRTSAPAENGVGRPPHISTTTTKKRPPLSNLTNHPRPSMVSCTATKSTKPKWSSATTQNAVLPQKTALPSTTSNIVVVSYKPKTQHQPQPPQPQRPSAASCDMDISPTPSNAHSVSISTCDSFNSPEVEYMDADALTITSNHPPLSDHFDTAGRFCKTEVLAATDIDNVVDVDDNYTDPQFCSTIACDIYNHLRASETQKRPLTDFMEQIQKDINASMRAILIDWLVEVAEEYRLVPDTLYLTVNYIDRYLSGNVMNRQRLQLLGVACMMIAAKYEEICAPQVEEFCYITDNTYFKDEVLHMESAVLNFLKFEMTAPTIKSFLRRFVRAAQVTNEISSIQLECFANYLAELSLLEYHMLQYAPSLIAASAVFLARYILSSSHKPWNSTLRHYTLYEPSDLEECVKALHQLCLNSHSSSLPAIREKYSQHKYKFVAKTYCPSSIPEEYFQNSSC